MKQRKRKTHKDDIEREKRKSGRNVEYMVEVYEPAIAKHVNVKEILPYMKHVIGMHVSFLHVANRPF